MSCHISSSHCSHNCMYCLLTDGEVPRKHHITIKFYSKTSHICSLSCDFLSISFFFLSTPNSITRPASSRLLWRKNILPGIFCTYKYAALKFSPCPWNSVKCNYWPAFSSFFFFFTFLNLIFTPVEIILALSSIAHFFLLTFLNSILLARLT